MKTLERLISLFIVSVSVAIAFFLQPARTSSSAPALTTSNLGITLGIQQPPTLNYGTEISKVNGLTGKRHGVVLFYTDWSHDFNYYSFLQDQINNQLTGTKPVTMLAWQPQNAPTGCASDYSGTAVPWSAIGTGGCDNFITTFANQIKARIQTHPPERYLIKFAHEMNGGAQLYSPQRTSVNPSGFVAAWQHMKTIFATLAVTNVEFVWAPIWQSYPNTVANDVHLYYPGDNYVDWIGPMGYNYYIYLGGAPQPWMTFDQIFGPTLNDFACLYPKPQIIHEFASAPGDASPPQTKELWIADAYSKAPNYPFLRSVIWYNDSDSANPGADFRITTSTSGNGDVQVLPPGSGAWTTAYANAIAAPTYTSALPSLIAAKPASTTCGFKALLPFIVR